MQQIADWMKQVMDLCLKAKNEEGLNQPDIQNQLSKIHQAVIELSLKFPVPAIINN